MFQTIIVQPLYNLLVAIYGVFPGHDLGLSLVLFTLLIRLALWPLLKRQLHQSKLMRDLQPELAKIKKASGGDRQKEGQLMMELYKERGISPFGSIGLTIIQLPLFIGVFQSARDLTQHLDKLSNFTYSFVADIPHVAEVIRNKDAFNFKSLGFIDLSQKAFQNGTIYIPILVLAIAATVFQFIQSKQLIPQPKEKKKLRDLLRASAGGKQPDQEDMTAAMSSSMLFLMPVLTILFAVAAQGAMVVYLLASSVIGIWQQSSIFKKDTEEMEAEVVSVKKTSVKTKAEKTAEPVEAEVIAQPAEKINKGKIVTKTRIISPSSTPAQYSSKNAKKKKRKKR
jgi:YidC/Oxa1 family membrane protein insertase